MVKKKIVYISITVILGLIIIFLLINLKYNKQISNSNVDLNLYVHFNDPSRLEIFNEELDLFNNLEPRFNINLYNLPFSDLDDQFRNGTLEPPADIIVSSAPASYGKDIFITEPISWTGQIWTLYYNKDVLKTIGIDPENMEDEISQSFSSGLISRKGMEETFSMLKDSGVTPITLGARYGWPLAAWIQHLTAFSGGIREAREMLSDSFDITSPYTEKAIQSFSFFVRKGWVIENYLDNDWPDALRQLIDGNAAFCLLSENLATSIPSDIRNRIGFIPFPQFSDDEPVPWRVGSLIYLGVPSSSQYHDDALKVLKFLTSSGTTSRLSKNLFLPFFENDWNINEKAKSAVRVMETIPSITSRTESPVILDIKNKIIELTEIKK